MTAVAADFNAYVEPLRDPDSACWTPDNSVDTSNHPGGTAMDLDWRTHPFQVVGTFTPAQQQVIREIVDFYEGMIGWAGPGYWQGGPVDEMHWQLGYNTYDRVNDQPFPRVFGFINRKIRPDGYSTFRRGAMPALDPVDVLARATGVTYQKAQQILPTVQDGLRLSQCTNTARLAMWLAQMGHESASFVYTEEIQSGDESTDRWKYKGRTWIQITWMSNYADFSRWLFNQGLISSPTYFVDNPKQLADLKWAGIGPAWYWTVQRSDINVLSDNRDIETVSRRINGTNPNTGRANGIDDRIARYNRASALGDQLLALINTVQPPVEEGFLMALSDQEQRDLYNAIMAPRQSRSPLREPGEGTVGNTTDVSWAMDGSIHVLIVELLAKHGIPSQIALLERVANNQLPDRQQDALLAQAILADLNITKEPNHDQS
jgi:putative chitinase